MTGMEQEYDERFNNYCVQKYDRCGVGSVKVSG